jgi:hypothetical protein
VSGHYPRLFGVMGLIVAAMLVLAACEVNIDAGSNQ